VSGGDEGKEVRRRGRGEAEERRCEERNREELTEKEEVEMAAAEARRRDGGVDLGIGLSTRGRDGVRTDGRNGGVFCGLCCGGEQRRKACSVDVVTRVVHRRQLWRDARRRYRENGESEKQQRLWGESEAGFRA